MEPIKSGSFTFSFPSGLLNTGVPRADKKMLSHYLHPVQPARKHQFKYWTPPRLTGKWCKAQLSHYGIKPLAGSKTELEQRLREAEENGLLKKQPAEMRLLEKYMKKEWKAKKDEADAKLRLRLKQDAEEDDGEEGGFFKMDINFGEVDVKKEKGDGKQGIGKRRVPGTKITTTAFSKKNILGTWDVSCPEIQTGWASTGGLTMVLFQDIESNSVVGELIFGAMEGVLRLKSNPSTKSPAVTFRWAGAVRGEEETQLGERDGEMRFYSRGEKARGSFGRIKGIGRDVEFDAVKVGNTPIKGRVDFSSYMDGTCGAGFSKWK